MCLHADNEEEGISELFPSSFEIVFPAPQVMLDDGVMAFCHVPHALKQSAIPCSTTVHTQPQQCRIMMTTTGTL